MFCRIKSFDFDLNKIKTQTQTKLFLTIPYMSNENEIGITCIVYYLNYTCNFKHI